MRKILVIWVLVAAGLGLKGQDSSVTQDWIIPKSKSGDTIHCQITSDKNDLFLFYSYLNKEKLKHKYIKLKNAEQFSLDGKIVENPWNHHQADNSVKVTNLEYPDFIVNSDGRTVACKIVSVNFNRIKLQKKSNMGALYYKYHKMSTIKKYKRNGIWSEVGNTWKGTEQSKPKQKRAATIILTASTVLVGIIIIVAVIFQDGLSGFGCC